MSGYNVVICEEKKEKKRKNSQGSLLLGSLYKENKVNF